MRINEYRSLNEFTDEYIGIWEPSKGHWFGLDFKYHNEVYRFNTGSMYNSEDTILDDGRTALFGVYLLRKEKTIDDREYVLIGEYADMDDVLEKCVINGVKFRDVITDDSTEILGKD